MTIVGNNAYHLSVCSLNRLNNRWNRYSSIYTPEICRYRRRI